VMANLTGESNGEALRLDFDRRLTFQFRGSCSRQTPACLPTANSTMRLDAAVVPFVRRQRSSASASCARLQSRQLPAHVGDARADKGLVADEPQAKADQDRRKGRQSRPLRRFPHGRSRDSEKSLRRHPAVDRRTAVAAYHVDSVKRSVVTSSIKNHERGAPR